MTKRRGTNPARGNLLVRTTVAIASRRSVQLLLSTLGHWTRRVVALPPPSVLAALTNRLLLLQTAGGNGTLAEFLVDVKLPKDMFTKLVRAGGGGKGKKGKKVSSARLQTESVPVDFSRAPLF